MEELYTFKVKTREDFIKFLNLLLKDYYEDPASWENKPLPEFLRAMGAFSESMQGYYNNTKQNVDADEPNWGTFADMFRAAKVYEA